MSETPREQEAARAIEALLAKPIPDRIDIWPGEEAAFDPWTPFPLYGSYSSEFDDMGIEVLRDIMDGTYHRADLAAEMFREMLCKMGLCDYGSSPRVCFPTQAFRRVLPGYLEKWTAYRKVQWADDV